MSKISSNSSQWAKISLDIFKNHTWGTLKYAIKNDTGKVFRAIDICTIFTQYILSSKKERKPVDVRTLQFDRIFFMKEEIVLEESDIDLINEYLVKAELLTKKYTIKSYYKWNGGDDFDSVNTVNEDVNSVNQNVNSVNEDVNQNVNTVNQFCKPNSRTNKAEYMQRYRLQKKSKTQALSIEESDLLQKLNYFFECKNVNSVNQNVNSVNEDVNQNVNTVNTVNTPLEIESKENRDIERIIKKTKAKKDCTVNGENKDVKILDKFLKSNQTVQENLSLDVWEKWAKYRKEIKKPLTESQISEQMEILEKGFLQGHDMNQAIKTSIASRWLSVFIPNDNSNKLLKNDTFRSSNKQGIITNYLQKSRLNEPVYINLQGGAKYEVDQSVYTPTDPKWHKEFANCESASEILESVRRGDDCDNKRESAKNPRELIIKQEAV